MKTEKDFNPEKYELETVVCSKESEVKKHENKGTKYLTEYLKRFYRIVDLQIGDATPDRVCVIYQNLNNPLDIFGVFYKPKFAKN